MRSPTLAIRADASLNIGSGHILRMIALGQAWMDRGGKVVFISQQCPAWLVDRIRHEGFEHRFTLASDMGSRADCLKTVDLTQELACNWIVLDGYHFTAQFQQPLQEAGLKVLAVDDYGHSDIWLTNAILNQNIYASTNSYRSIGDDCSLMLGLRFVLLRKEFSSAINKGEATSTVLRKILLTLGGEDPGNITGRVIHMLNTASTTPLEVRVLVRSHSPHLDELKKLALSTHHSIDILTDVRDMPKMYLWADGVISAGGSTCYEWLRYGLPGCVITIAKNQQLVTKALTERQLATDLGWHDQLDTEGSLRNLQSWLATEHLHRNTDVDLVDGYGASRVAAFLDNGIWLRRASKNDERLYFDWANDLWVRQNSIQSKKIDWAEHVQWFSKQIRSDNSRLMVAMIENKQIGQVRFERKEFQEWEIGLSLAFEERGKGLASKIIELAIRQLRSEGIATIIAKVKSNNKPSISSFEKLGFQKMASETIDPIWFRLEASRII